ATVNLGPAPGVEVRCRRVYRLNRVLEASRPPYVRKRYRHFQLTGIVPRPSISHPSTRPKKVPLDTTTTERGRPRPRLATLHERAPGTRPSPLRARLEVAAVSRCARPARQL